MKKNIKKILLLIVILLIISSVIIVVKGRTYTYKFNIRENNYKLEIENPEIVEILEEKEDNNKYIVKLKGKKEGKAYLLFEQGDTHDFELIYVHKTLVITNNNFFGYSVGSEIIPVCLSIFFIYILFLLIKEYKNSIKENLYRYKNVAYLGIIIFLSNLVLDNLYSIINYQGLYTTVNKTINSMGSLSFILGPTAVISLIIALVTSIQLFRKEGKSIRNLLSLFLGIIICVLSFLPNFVYNILMRLQIINIYNLNSAGPYIYNFIEALDYLVVAYLECVLIGTIVIGIKAARKKINHDKDYMIILGCKICKDGSLPPLLRGRVDKALDFRNEQLKETNKDLVFIPSGGKGPDEVISEALAMKNYLIEKGIKEKSILLEDKSKNTYENIKFSNKLIKKKNANIAYSTTNYHVFRAGSIATEQGIKIEGIGSKTKFYYWVNAFVREFIGTLYSEKKKHILVFTFIILALIIMILITYYANNL